MNPGEAIRDELKKRGWGQEVLAHVMGRPVGRVNEIIQGKQAISADIALDLARAFGNEQDATMWLRLESDYRLSLAKSGTESVSRRGKLFRLGPVKEMIRRGWIREAVSDEGLENEVLKFFGLDDINETPSIHGAMRKSGPELSASPQQAAWAVQIRRLASAIPNTAVGIFDESKLRACKLELRRLAAYSAGVSKASSVLMSYGIRFVVVEGLHGAKMDGFATWLSDCSPVIGMSLKYDRMDSFWFTLGHEFSHIENRDIAPIDGNVGKQDDSLEDALVVTPPMELRANEQAAAMFIPEEELSSFIRRVHPMYSIERINQFANSIKMHPSIIIGQLKHRGKIGYSRFSRPTYPIRDAVIGAAVVDGWGKSIQLGEQE